MDVGQDGMCPRVMQMNVANLYDYLTGGKGLTVQAVQAVQGVQGVQIVQAVWKNAPRAVKYEI